MGNWQLHLFGHFMMPLLFFTFSHSHIFRFSKYTSNCNHSRIYHLVVYLQSVPDHKPVLSSAATLLRLALTAYNLHMAAVQMAITPPRALVTKAALLMMTVFAPGNFFFVLFLFMFCNITNRFFFS